MTIKRNTVLFASVLGVLLLTFTIYSCTQKKGNQAESVQKTAMIESSSGDEQLLTDARKVFSTLPDTIQNPNNKVTPQKVALGKMLYYDTRLSKSNTISCNSCHNMASYGVDNNFNSLGHGWKLGGRNSPTVLNSALDIAEFWDGRAKDVEDQAKGPILNPVEMGMPGQSVAIERISTIPEYIELFKKSFPEGDNKVTYDNIANAIGAFERTLTTPSRFDKFLNGDTNALTAQEKTGLKMFMDVGCSKCHTGAAIGGQMYQKFGLVNGPYWKYTNSDHQDEGRYKITNQQSDKYVFKVPILRNIAHTYPYFHDGSVWDLSKAVDIMGETQLGRKLTESETNDIIAFLKSLTGTIPEDALKLPILPPSTSQTPKPHID